MKNTNPTKEKRIYTIPRAYKLDGWRSTNASGTKCEKVYQIAGRWYLCLAELDTTNGTWRAELFWPDEFGFRPINTGPSLESVACQTAFDIDVLLSRDHDHNRVDCEGAMI